MSDIKKNPLDIYEDMKAGRIKLAKKSEEDNDSSKLLNEYLAMLRLAFMVHQHSHWKCSGSGFYGNHLLFERLYNETKKMVDAVAEKIVGSLGPKALDHTTQCELMNSFNNYTSDNHLSNSLNVCKDICEKADDLFNRLKNLESMSLGMEDLIQSQINKLESHRYLLSQANS